MEVVLAPLPCRGSLGSRYRGVVLKTMVDSDASHQFCCTYNRKACVRVAFRKMATAEDCHKTLPNKNYGIAWSNKVTDMLLEVWAEESTQWS